MTRKLEAYGIGLTAEEELIRLQKLGDHGPELLGERLESRSLRSESRDVVARRDPDSGFGIPDDLDMVEEVSHQVKRIPQDDPSPRKSSQGYRSLLTAWKEGGGPVKAAMGGNGGVPATGGVAPMTS